MSTIRLTADLRREQIRDAAKACFARYGYAGTTTRSVAVAACISEGLLFKHFPTKAALYADILEEECKADPEFHRLLELEPSTETLIILIREVVAHFIAPDHAGAQNVARDTALEKSQRIRLLISSHLDDGEFARLMFEKIEALIGPVFAASLERAIENGDAVRVEGSATNMFWFAHQLLHMIALTQLPHVPTLSFPDKRTLELHLCRFILRGIGLANEVIDSYFGENVTPEFARHMPTVSIAESI
jgi:AcrR family transcriptional regulator